MIWYLLGNSFVANDDRKRAWKVEFAGKFEEFAREKTVYLAVEVLQCSHRYTLRYGHALDHWVGHETGWGCSLRMGMYVLHTT